MAFYGAGAARFRRGLPGLLALAITAALFAAGKEVVRYLRVENVQGRVEVVDGDSLRMAGDDIRLSGIDAPELHQTCFRGAAEEPCGRAARAALLELVGRAPVTCAVSGRDRYDRKLAVCKAGEVEINRAMVRAGQAVAYGDYESEEDEARRARRGVWAGRFERPADWRARHPRPHGS